MDPKKLVESVSALNLVEFGGESFVATDRGLVNIRHVTHIAADNNDLLLEVHSAHAQARIVSDVKPAAQVANPGSYPRHRTPEGVDMEFRDGAWVKV